jgi:hypothetical protein
VPVYLHRRNAVRSDLLVERRVTDYMCKRDLKYKSPRELALLIAKGCIERREGMPKRISITLLFIAAFVIGALFVATEVRAFSDFSGTPDVIATVEGWTVELVDKACKPILNTPGWFDCHYKIYSGDPASVKGLNFAALFVPDCERGPKIDFDFTSPPSTGWNDYFDPAVGEPTLKLGLGNAQVSILQGEPDKSSSFHAIANTDQLGSTTFAIKVKRLGLLVFPNMAGPACPILGFAPKNPPVTEFSLGDRKICFLNDSLGCSTLVYRCIGDPGEPSSGVPPCLAADTEGPAAGLGCAIPEVDVTLDAGGTNQNAFLECNTFDFNGLCPSVCGVQIGSPNCQFISIGGVPYGPICW